MHGPPSLHYGNLWPPNLRGPMICWLGPIKIFDTHGPYNDPWKFQALGRNVTIFHFFGVSSWTIVPVPHYSLLLQVLFVNRNLRYWWIGSGNIVLIVNTPQTVQFSPVNTEHEIWALFGRVTVTFRPFSTKHEIWSTFGRVAVTFRPLIRSMKSGRGLDPAVQTFNIFDW